MIASSSSAALSWITFQVSLDISGAFWPVFGSTYWYKRFIVFVNDLLVTLCRLETAIRAANFAKSGWRVVIVAAISAARLSSSVVVTPSYRPLITFIATSTGLTNFG